ncbi:hypothetical protein UlMin_008651 [Ulmus minor]
MLSDSFNSSSSPNKRLKTLAGTSILSSNFKSKSKSKMEDDSGQQEAEMNQLSSDNSTSRSCAICFREDGRVIRGEIDCCDHYFCFLCIMEWAKTESRCPICRRRFSTIRRPPNDMAFVGERVIKVPVRDQALIHFENPTGNFDPYGDVCCTVCHCKTDENLLLLCDLCDLASHTYCVGLGVNVPEGDWFCHDCSMSRDEHARNEVNTEDDEKNITNPSLLNATVQESSSQVVERRPTRAISGSKRPYPTGVRDGVNSSKDERTAGPTAKTSVSVSRQLTESGARTLDRCRSVHSHIRVLRANWNAYRSGSLSFSSSKSSQQCRNQDGCGSQDTEKAWKMMEIAKSKARKKTSSVCLSKPPHSKASASKERTNVNSSHMVKCQLFGARDLGRAKIENCTKNSSSGKGIKSLRGPESEMQNPSRVIREEVAGCSTSLSETYSPKSSFPSNVLSSSEDIGTCHVKKSKFVQANVNKASSNVTREQNLSACSIRPRNSDSTVAKPEPCTSYANVGVPKQNCRLDGGHAESKGRKDNDAKSEIQTLVKLNLKLLSKNKRLEVASFKEIARLSTHTILAACGLDHRKAVVYNFPGLECSHTEANLSEQLPKSNLMPNSCQQCFHSFVKNVVSSIMFDKVSCAKST